MSTGTVTTYLEKGFGFIRTDDRGSDLFVHITDVANRDELRTGERVEFEVAEDQRSGKLRAKKVRVL